MTPQTATSRTARLLTAAAWNAARAARLQADSAYRAHAAAGAAARRSVACQHQPAACAQQDAKPAARQYDADGEIVNSPDDGARWTAAGGWNLIGRSPYAK